MSEPVSLLWRAASALLVAWLVAACSGMPGAGAGRDLPTASDQTDADRRARVRLELASAYFERGQTSTALDEVKLALVADPNYGEAFNLRGLIYASMGETALAQDSFARALQINPRDADAMHNFGWFLCQQRRFEQADAQFRQALAQPQYQDTVRTLLAQGLCQARAGRFVEAESTLLRSYELDPSNPATAVNLTELLYRRGEYERARFYIRRVNSRQELSSAQTLWLAARVENRLGQHGAVRELGDQLRTRFPRSPEAVLFERGQFDD